MSCGTRAFVWLVVLSISLVFSFECGAFPAPEIGAVREVQVWGYGTPPQARREPKYARDTVVADELVETVKKGAMSIDFIDGTELHLGGSSRLVIDEMVYSPKDKKGKAVIDLVEGTYYFVSGKIPKQNVMLRTPTATIGIRGTALSITVKGDGSTVVGVVSGAADVRSKATGKTTSIDVGQTAGVSATGESTGQLEGVSLTGDDKVDSKIVQATYKTEEKVTLITEKVEELIERTVALTDKKVERFLSKGTRKGRELAAKTRARAQAKIDRLQARADRRIEDVQARGKAKAERFAGRVDRKGGTVSLAEATAGSGRSTHAGGFGFGDDGDSGGNSGSGGNGRRKRRRIRWRR